MPRIPPMFTYLFFSVCVEYDQMYMKALSTYLAGREISDIFPFSCYSPRGARNCTPTVQETAVGNVEAIVVVVAGLVVLCIGKSQHEPNRITINALGF